VAGGFIRPGSKVRDLMPDVGTVSAQVARLTAEQSAELPDSHSSQKNSSPPKQDDRVHYPVLAALMEADAGKGVSNDPDDCSR